MQSRTRATTQNPPETLQRASRCKCEERVRKEGSNNNEQQRAQPLVPRKDSNGKSTGASNKGANSS
eukprot:3644955-Pyramimonas_sp.AAC.1